MRERDKIYQTAAAADKSAERVKFLWNEIGLRPVRSASEMRDKERLARLFDASQTPFLK